MSAFHILTSDYFAGEISVSGISGLSVAALANKAVLDRFILKYEAKFLKKLLGDELYADFVRGWGAGVVDQKWQDLADQLYDTVDKLSIVANYVYFFYRRYLITVTTTGAEAESAYENSTPTSNNMKATQAWNEMSDGVDDFYSWLYYNNSEYSDWQYPMEVPYRKINTFGF